MQILSVLGGELVAMLYLLAFVALVGAAAFHFMIWRQTSLPLGPVRTTTEEQVVALTVRCGTWSSLALLLLAIPRMLGVATALNDRFSFRERVEALVFRSEWGIGLAAVLAAALISLLGYRLVARRNGLGWPLALAAVPLLGIGAGLQGHPGDTFANLSLAPIFDGFHAIGVGSWLGSYLLLVVASARVPAHTASPWTDPLGAMLERYFRASGAMGTAVLLTGLFSSATHLTSFGDITGSQYGRVLAGKVGIVGILMVLNEYHRRHAERQARTVERPQLLHTLRFQAGLIVLVLALTVLLLDATPPGVNEVRSEVFRAAPRDSYQADDIEIEH